MSNGHLGIPLNAMSTSDLKSLLDDVPDTFEIVLRRDPSWSPVFETWRDAAEEASEALAAWRRRPSRSAYAVYRAAQDREDAAFESLRQSHTSRTSVS
jgi:hypothetical protein